MIKNLKHTAFVVDLDGTVMCGKQRLHLRPPIEETDLPHAWDAFNMACEDDTPLPDTIALVNAMYEAGHVPLFITGRREVAYKLTVRWLVKHFYWFDPSVHVLIMRDLSDCGRPVDCKLPKIKILAEQYHLLFAIDDDPLVVDALRREGINAYQVRNWQENQ